MRGGGRLIFSIARCKSPNSIRNADLTSDPATPRQASSTQAAKDMGRKIAELAAGTHLLGSVAAAK
jgi:hypothetical protein